jgi:hypothetical protein
MGNTHSLTHVEAMKQGPDLVAEPSELFVTNEGETPAELIAKPATSAGFFA